MINLKVISDYEDITLTKRELEIFILRACGFSRKEIGEKLFITLSTVNTHLMSVYQKLSVNNFNETVNLAFCTITLLYKDISLLKATASKYKNTLKSPVINNFFETISFHKDEFCELIKQNRIFQ